MLPSLMQFTLFKPTAVPVATPRSVRKSLRWGSAQPAPVSSSVAPVLNASTTPHVSPLAISVSPPSQTAGLSRTALTEAASCAHFALVNTQLSDAHDACTQGPGSIEHPVDAVDRPSLQATSIIVVTSPKQLDLHRTDSRALSSSIDDGDSSEDSNTSFEHRSLLDWAAEANDSASSSSASTCSFSPRTDSPGTSGACSCATQMPTPPRYDLAAAFANVGPPAASPTRLQKYFYDAQGAIHPSRRLSPTPSPSTPFVVHHVNTLARVEPSPGISLLVGTPVLVHVPHSSPPRLARAFVRYLGSVVGEDGPRVGLELAVCEQAHRFEEALDEAVVGGIKYFEANGVNDDWNSPSGDRRHYRRQEASDNVGTGRCLFVRPDQVAWVKDA